LGRAIKLTNNLYRIPTLGSFINTYAFINDDGSVTLVDCGLKKAPAKIVAGLASIGKHPRDVENIILTHAHDDHIGGAAKMIELSNPKFISMHEEDSSYPEKGTTPKVDTRTVSGKLMSRMPASKYTPFKVNKELKGGELIDTAGGLKVIHTPGHTDGHISLLHLESKTLITGDSIFNMTSRLTWSLSGFCVDYLQSQETAKRFVDLDFKHAAFTHGPEIMDKGKERITKFLVKR
jgi:glyoxylase-like metal-dependent hydrolase (beta-lactamase superfamily II)